MRVAYYSPLPPSRSGIADYSALLLPALRERVDVSVAHEGLDPDADVALYHVGNDPQEHGWIVDALERRPGVVVLHEFVLHHLVSGVTLARGDVDGYLRAMEREAGLVGRLLAQSVADGKVAPLWETRPHDFPLAAEVLGHATAVVVHSRFVADAVRETGYAQPVHVIPMPAWPAVEAAPDPLEGDPLIGCFGHQNESKRIPQLYAAFARLRETRPDARLVVVGSASRGVENLVLPEGAARESYVPEERLWSLMTRADVHVSLRWPTMGETSAAVIRSLSLGRPLVVSSVGWFSELPEEVALKVAPGEREIDALAEALERLCDQALRARMAAAALELARTEHGLSRVADRYAGVLAGSPVPA